MIDPLQPCTCPVCMVLATTTGAGPAPLGAPHEAAERAIAPPTATTATTNTTATTTTTARNGGYAWPLAIPLADGGFAWVPMNVDVARPQIELPNTTTT